MWRLNIHNDPRFRVWYQRIDRHPSWVRKLSIAAAVLVVVVPLVLVTLAALLVGLVVFVVAAAAASVLGIFSGRTGGPGVLTGTPGSPPPVDEGRRNVRVIDPPR